MGIEKRPLTFESGLVFIQLSSRYSLSYYMEDLHLIYFRVSLSYYSSSLKVAVPRFLFIFFFIVGISELEIFRAILAVYCAYSLLSCSKNDIRSDSVILLGQLEIFFLF